MKKKFEKKSHNAEKNWKGGPFGNFQHPFWCKTPKKNWKGGPFGNFQHPFCCKTPKKIEGGLSWWKVFLKKIAQCRKNGPFGLVRYCMLCGKPFWFSSLGQQVHFGVFWKCCRTFGRTILVSSGGLKKTLTKSHDYSRLFSKEKRRLKIVYTEENHLNEIL